MAANPALCAGPGGVPAPTPFVGEVPLLLRDGIDYEIDSLERCGLGLPSRCSFSGRLYLSTVRVVLVSRRDNPLRAFDMPLAYVRGERFNQPIFGANNLAGAVFSVADGGPAGGQPPHGFTIYFKEGGCGTFLPLFFQALQRAREAAASPLVAPRDGGDVELRDLRAAAFVDPGDPTVIFLPRDDDDDVAQLPAEQEPTPAPPAYPAAGW